MTDVINHPAFKEGERLYLSGQKYDNPYPSGSDERNIFERGWSQALKRVPEDQAKQIELKRQLEAAGADAIKAKATLKAKNAYLRRKG
jgi:hypothetical protein